MVKILVSAHLSCRGTELDGRCDRFVRADGAMQDASQLQTVMHVSRTWPRIWFCGGDVL